MADPKPSAEAMHVADTYAYCTDAVCTNGEWCHEMRTGLALALDAFATARVAEAVAAERAEVNALLVALRCHDNSCIFGRSGGMGTNGGCRTLKDKDDTRRALMTLVQQLRARAKGGGNGNV